MTFSTIVFGGMLVCLGIGYCIASLMERFNGAD